MWWRRKFDSDRIARSHLSARHDDAHDPRAAHQIASFVAAERCGHEPGLDAVELRARVTQARYLDDCRVAETQPRPGREREQFEPSRGDVLAHLARSHAEPGAAQLVV